MTVTDQDDTHPPAGLFIRGEWRTPSGPDVVSVNPVDGSTVWRTATATPGDVAAAVDAARAAFAPWSALSVDDRLAYVEAFRREISARGPQLAALISAETGKPMWDALGEAGAVAGKVAISIAAFGQRTGDRSSDTAFGQARLTHRPLGVMGVFGPFNFPAHLPNGHMVPALIAGNTVVLKPSELTPAVGAFLVECWRAAGLPDGVVNLVQGGRDTGAALLDAPLDGVLFTGSADTGVMIHRHFAGRPDVMVALEMGGNNPLIAWDFADVEAAAIIALQSGFITSGQRCTCARRLIVPDDARGEALVAALLAAMDRVIVGAPDDDPEPFMGPVISAMAGERVMDAHNALLAKGGKPLRACTRQPGSAFVTPGLVDVTGIDCPDAEVFGPLMRVIRVADFDAAIDQANATKFGLSAGLISDDAALWGQAQARLRAGIVNWNRPTTGAASNLPFGGPGLSGNLRPSAYYAADYCAFPMASQCAPRVEPMATKGLRPTL